MSEAKVDILVCNLKALPFLKLQWAQINKFKPTIPFRYIVWDSGSSDDAPGWLSSQGIQHGVDRGAIPHATALKKLLPLSTAPLVAFMDSDCFPIKPGWLDSSVELLESDPKLGAVGLSYVQRCALDSPRRNHPEGTMYCHPAFSIWRRDVYDRLKLDTEIVVYENKDVLNIGGSMSLALEAGGYRWEPIGHAAYLCQGPAQLCSGQKVIHIGGASIVLCNDSGYGRAAQVQVVEWHRTILGRFGLFDDFKKYLKESVLYNPLVSRYGILG